MCIHHVHCKIFWHKDLDCLVFLAQSDTTVGLLSKDFKKLNFIKQRKIDQKVLIEVASLKILKSHTRVPSCFKSYVRRAKKTSFIYPNNKALRVVKDEMHLRFLKPFLWMYSTSANKTKERFDLSWAREVSDVEVLDCRGLKEARASKIYKLSNTKIKKVR